MKTTKLPGILLFVLTVSVGCYSFSTIEHTSTSIPINTITPAPIIPSLTPTESLLAKKEKILEEVRRLENEYDRLVTMEKKIGEGEITHTDDTGEERFMFKGKSYEKINQAYLDLSSQTASLFEQYLILYRQDHFPTPYPTQGTKEQTLQYYTRLSREDQIWMETLLKSENVDKVYNPYTGDYGSVIRFDDAAWHQLAAEAMDNMRLSAELSPELLSTHIARIKSLEPAIQADDIQRNVTSLPFYRKDLSFYQYTTKVRTYVLNVSGNVVEIIPLRPPHTADLTPIAPKNTANLEEEALKLINLFSPNIELNGLTRMDGTKINTFFFRWEDQTKPLLDDGRSYPFLQVGLNADGELLNYYNTLPLAR